MSKASTTTKRTGSEVTKAGAGTQIEAGYDKVVSALEGNPLAALLGGIALGAAAGVLIPRSEREKAVLAPLGERLAEAARAALAAGREAGGDALDEAGISVDGLREQISALLSQAAGAAGTAGSAAFAAARDKVRG